MSIEQSGIPIRNFIRALYGAILKRTPSENEIESHIKNFLANDANSLSLIVDLFLNSPEYKNSIENHASNYKETSQQALKAVGSYIAYPVYNEIWLPFALSCSRYMWDEYGLKTFFIVDYSFNAIQRCVKDFDFLIGFIDRDGYESLVKRFPPSILFAHSGIWNDFTNNILEASPHSVFMLIGDLFRNNVHMRWETAKYVHSAITWGFDDGFAPNYNKVIIEYDNIEHYRSLLADYAIPGNPHEEITSGYDVFYVRYWSEGGAYNDLPREIVVSSWVDTVLNNNEREKTIIIKGDSRVSSAVKNDFRVGLEKAGVKCILFEDLLRKYGEQFIGLDLLPVEYSYCKNLLCSASNHYVLDSALAYVISMHDNIRRPSNIVIGVNSLHCDNFSQVALDQIDLFVKHSTDAICNSHKYNVSIESRGALCNLVRMR